MTTPTVTETRRNGNPVGERIELARYTVPGGERILYGQRVDGVVLFLPGEPVALVGARALSDDGVCRSCRRTAAGVRAHAVRQKRRSDHGARRSAARDAREVLS
jgi:hypothetical protein